MLCEDIYLPIICYSLFSEAAPLYTIESAGSAMQYKVLSSSLPCELHMEVLWAMGSLALSSAWLMEMFVENPVLACLYQQIIFILIINTITYLPLKTIIARNNESLHRIKEPTLFNIIKANKSCQ